MRLVKIDAPEGRGDEVAKIAFAVGIDKVARRRIEIQHRDGIIESRDVIDIETSTPQAKRFIDALLAADFYRPEDISINVRQPRSLVSKTSLPELTRPFGEPATDILEELWQFSHITASFVGRVFIGSCLIAYGMIEQAMLLIIAGLFILPLVPLMLGMSFGVRSGIWKLTGQAARAFSVATVLLFLGGACIGAVSEPPIKYDEFNSLLAGALISAGVGIAAGLANIDDAGHRQLIGLAASAQIALIPVWFGICAVLGFPGTATRNDIIQRAASFFLNIAVTLVATFVVYTLSRAASGVLKNTQTAPDNSANALNNERRIA